MKISRFWLPAAAFFVLLSLNSENSHVFAVGRQQSSPAGAAANASAILNPVGTLPIVKEPITLAIGHIRGNNLTTDVYTNYKTLELQKDSGIKLEFVWYGSSSGEAYQLLQLQVMAGGNELPDIINFGVDATTQVVYGRDGIFIPFDDYIRTSAYWINQNINEIPVNPWDVIRAPDGHIYSFFSYGGDLSGEVGGRGFINTVWLQEAGLALPTNTMEFENMLRAFKNRQPNADGRVTYPFITDRDRTRNTDFLGTFMSPFIYYGGSGNRYFYKEPNGTISPSFVTENWRQGLSWIRGMVDQGLIDPLSFTQDAEQMRAIANSTPYYAMGATTFAPSNYYAADDPRRRTWVIMGPLSGPNGGDPVPSWSMSTINGTWYVTKNCKYPEAAFRLGDLLMSEKYALISRWGEEGVDWFRAQPGDRTYFDGVAPYMRVPNDIWGTVNNKLWTFQQAPRLIPYKVFNGLVMDERNPSLTAIAANLNLPYIKTQTYIGPLSYSLNELEEVGEIRANVESYLMECFTRFILRDMSLENDWNRYLTELRNMGLDTLVRVNRAAYARMYR